MPPPSAAPAPPSRAFVRRLLRAYADGELTNLIQIGHATGLWTVLANGGGTAAEIARRARLDPRYVDEWLRALAVARVLRYDARRESFHLAPSRAACLAGPGIYNLAPGSGMVAIGARHLPRVARAFRSGKGIPAAVYEPEFSRLMDDLNRRRYDALLVPEYVRLAPGLEARLRRGIRVLDFGTGSGHPVNLLARAYPRSRFVGVELARLPLARARREARSLGLRNVRFVRGGVSSLRTLGRFDLLTAFDVIHDLAWPEATVAALVRRLRPNGRVLIGEPRASSDLGENIGRTGAAYLYGVSVTYCLPVSRAGGPGGLGTCWGVERAKALLESAGVARVRVRPAPGNALAVVITGRILATHPRRRRSAEGPALARGGRSCPK